MNKRRGTHLVPVSESDQDPSRNILEWKRILEADTDSRYEVDQITLQFQKSIDSNTTTITVWGVKVSRQPSIPPFYFVL